jgi:predicted transcriptional regulator
MKRAEDMEEMELFMWRGRIKCCGENVEGWLEKERNLAVIESAARSEQSMLKEAVRNSKVEKIRLQENICRASVALY